MSGSEPTLEMLWQGAFFVLKLYTWTVYLVTDLGVLVKNLFLSSTIGLPNWDSLDEETVYSIRHALQTIAQPFVNPFKHSENGFQTSFRGSHFHSFSFSFLFSFPIFPPSLFLPPLPSLLSFLS